MAATGSRDETDAARDHQPQGHRVPTEVNGHVDQALDTTDCAVRVLHAMQGHGLAVQQILVADTSARVYGAVLAGDLRLGNDGS
jgi:hypothetical protein